MKYGYARVSSSEQDHARQVAALKAAGAAKIFSDKGQVCAGRPQLARAIAALEQGDVLTVSRVECVSRSSRDLLDIVRKIEARGATFESLGEPWASTNTPQATATLTLIAAVAEQDRAFNLADNEEE